MKRQIYFSGELEVAKKVSDAGEAVADTATTTLLAAIDNITTVLGTKLIVDVDVAAAVASARTVASGIPARFDDLWKSVTNPKQT